MRTVPVKAADLESCIRDAQRESLVLTRNGKPVALVVGVEGMDDEQLQLGSSGKFWELIAKRRTQKTLSRAQLEQRLKSKTRN